MEHVVVMLIWDNKFTKVLQPNEVLRSCSSFGVALKYRQLRGLMCLEMGGRESRAASKMAINPITSLVSVK